jgi:DNA primase
MRIQEIKNNTDLLALVSEYTDLRADGFGCCPFPGHDEKTPSFHVEVRGDSQFCWCFGCQRPKGGDAIGFIMEVESLDFGQAVEFLARRLGVSADQTVSASDILYYTAAYYQRAYHSALLPAHLSYLLSRGIAQTLIDSEGIGYCPGVLKSPDKDMYFAARELGFIRDNFTGGHDAFLKGRITIPIRDRFGRVVAFSGRALGADSPKYLGTPNSAIYEKKMSLFGWHVALPEIRKTGVMVVVEGYFDAYAAWEHGIKNVVACSGTALTEEQLHNSRPLKKVVLAMDADGAGQEAVRKSILLCRALGIAVEVSELEKYKDFGEALQRGDGAAIKAAVQQTKPAELFAEDTAFICETASKMPPAEREKYLLQAAERIGISFEALSCELSLFQGTKGASVVSAFEFKRRG